MTLTFYGAVLHLRGDTVCRQPHVAQSGNVLLWNGEIFDGIVVDQHENDGQVLMTKLESISERSLSDYSKTFLDIMDKIEGPYAFLYFHVRFPNHGRTPDKQTRNGALRRHFLRFASQSHRLHQNVYSLAGIV